MVKKPNSTGRVVFREYTPPLQVRQRPLIEGDAVDADKQVGLGSWPSGAVEQKVNCSYETVTAVKVAMAMETLARGVRCLSQLRGGEESDGTPVPENEW